MASYKLQQVFCILLIASLFSVAIGDDEWEIHDEIKCTFSSETGIYTNITECQNCCNWIFPRPSGQPAVNAICVEASGISGPFCACNALRRQGSPKADCKKMPH